LSIFVKIRRSEYFKSAIVILLIVAVVLGVFFSVQFALGTAVPIRVVESGSMCVPYDGLCNGWSHPFEQTLHVGDIIVIQKINPADIPTSTPIVHRVVQTYKVNGTLYFQTKGDGNSGDKWPNIPGSQEYDSRTLWSTGQGVPQDLVIGKVVMRIPYFGWVTLFLRNNPWGLPVVIALIFLLVFLEFVIPVIRGKKDNPEEEQKNKTIEDNSTLTGL
jgi:signal peptidase I